MQRRRWKNNIQMDLGMVGCDAGHLIDLAQDRVQRRAYVWTNEPPDFNYLVVY